MVRAAPDDAAVAPFELRPSLLVKRKPTLLASAAAPPRGSELIRTSTRFGSVIPRSHSRSLAFDKASSSHILCTVEKLLYFGYSFVKRENRLANVVL